MVAIFVLSAVVLVLVAVIALFYRRVGRADWTQSDVRMSAIAFIAAIGPFFGLRLKQPPPERPAVLEPKGNADQSGPMSDLDHRIATDDELQSPVPMRKRQ